MLTSLQTNPQSHMMMLSLLSCGVVGHPDCGYDECKAVDAYFNGPFKWTPPESHYERYKFVADIDGCVLLSSILTSTCG